MKPTAMKAMKKAKKPAAPRASERQIQKAIFDFLRLALPSGAWVGAIPGGDGRATRTPGYVAGTPDLMIVHCGAAYFLEVKTATGSVSNAQRDTRGALWHAGAKTSIVRDVQGAEYACAHLWNIPLRASVKAAA